MARGYSPTSTGTLITATYANDQWLKQGVLYFADSTARSSAITSPEEGMVSYLADVDRFEFYNGSAWAPLAFATLRKNSTGTVYARKRINLIEGTGVTLTVADDSGNDEVDITIAASVANPVSQKVKSADETVTSSTTLQDDDVLTIALATNTDHFFDAWLYVNAPAAPDIKVAVTVPAGATLTAEFRVAASGSTYGNSTLVTASGTAVTFLPNGDAFIRITGSVRNGATAGNVTVQWAQDTSSGTATTVKAGSTLMVVQET